MDAHLEANVSPDELKKYSQPDVDVEMLEDIKREKQLQAAQLQWMNRYGE